MLHPRLEKCLVLAQLLYPVVLLAGFLATWQIAGWSLGHPPRPSLDDPKYINRLVSVGHTFTLILLMLLPVFALGSLLFGATAAFDRVRAGRRLLVASTSALLLTAVILLLRADPFQMVTWLMD